jgi:hypothetical protein
MTGGHTFAPGAFTAASTGFAGAMRPRGTGSWCIEFDNGVPMTRVLEVQLIRHGAPSVH